MFRLQCEEPYLGVRHVWDLPLHRLLRRSPQSRRAHQLREASFCWFCLNGESVCWFFMCGNLYRFAIWLCGWFCIGSAVWCIGGVWMFHVDEFRALRCIAVLCHFLGISPSQLVKAWIVNEIRLCTLALNMWFTTRITSLIFH